MLLFRRSSGWTLSISKCKNTITLFFLFQKMCCRVYMFANLIMMTPVSNQPQTSLHVTVKGTVAAFIQCLHLYDDQLGLFKYIE